MKTLIAAALIFAAQGASAAGFQPWAQRAVIDDNATGQSAVVQAAGFGPWRERNVIDVIDPQRTRAVVLQPATPNIFRPWS